VKPDCLKNGVVYFGEGENVSGRLVYHQQGVTTPSKVTQRVYQHSDEGVKDGSSWIFRINPASTQEIEDQLQIEKDNFISLLHNPDHIDDIYTQTILVTQPPNRKSMRQF